MNRTFSILLLAVLGMATPALASSNREEPKQIPWSFEGPMGRFDKPAIQRGFQVYKEVCSACHSLKRVAFRQMAEIGFSEAEVKALAAGYTVKDGPNDAGEMFERPGRPSDTFPSNYANDKAAAAANGGAVPPDMSLLAKAREDGPNYIFSLITGYGAVPSGITVPEGAHYNPYMEGHVIKMPMPLRADAVTYQDGTKATLEQEAKDVVNFLQWAAEPEMEERKSLGLHVMLFLGVMTGLFYLVKKRVWSDLH